MTDLTIKDLNCSTCPEWQVRHMYECDIAGRLSPAMLELIKNVGCASHPLALQVLAGPVIAEPEKVYERHDGDGQYFGGFNYGIDEALNHLKGDSL